MNEPIRTRESTVVGEDEHSGVRIIRLTGAPAIHHNIYGEVSYMDPSSRYLMYLQSYRPYGPDELWRADLQTHQLTLMADNLPGIRGVAISPDQKLFYFMRTYGEDDFEIVRMDMESFAEEVFRIDGPDNCRSLGSVTPDNRYYIHSTWLDIPRFGIVKYDLEERTCEIIEERDDIHNAHPQIEPSEGEIVCIQHNRGSKWADGKCVRSTGELGATLYFMDINGENRQELPIGEPYTFRCQGHQCWIGMTGELLFTVSEAGAGRTETQQQQRYEKVVRQGNMYAIAPGDDQPRVVSTGFRFTHPNVSRDGRFFVADTHPGGDLVVGSIKSGRARKLCETGTTFSSAQYTHPHPYFSPDCKWVIYNSDCTGVPHIYAASVPEGLLEELEQE